MTYSDNGFELSILVDGSPISPFTREGFTYFPVPNRSRFQIRLGNHRDTPCDAIVHLDGKEIGGFVWTPMKVMDLDRPAGKKRQFVFVGEETEMAQEAGVQAGRSQNGLVEVKFKPGRRRRHGYSGNTSPYTPVQRRMTASACPVLRHPEPPS